MDLCCPSSRRRQRAVFVIRPVADTPLIVVFAKRESCRFHGILVLTPVREVPDEVATLKLSEIEIKSYVGGLVKSFERKAACDTQVVSDDCHPSGRSSRRTVVIGDCL